MSFESAPIRGVVQHYNSRTTNQKWGSGQDDGMRKQAVYVFDGNDLPAAGANNEVFQFPAYSKVLGGYVEILEATADIGDRTTLTFNTTLGDVTDMDIVLTDAAASGTFARGRAGYIDLKDATILDVGTSAAELVVNSIAASGGTTGTYDNSGRFRIVIDYVLEGPAQV